MLQVAYDLAYHNFFRALDHVEVTLSKTKCAGGLGGGLCDDQQVQQHAETMSGYLFPDKAWLSGTARFQWRLGWPCSVAVMYD